MRRREAIYEEDHKKTRKKRKRWHRFVTLLASVVVFYTTYALILPAITLERECDIPEHTHADECYTLTEITPCVLDGKQPHVHDDSCFNARGEEICGYADFVLHTHSEICYDQNGELWCTLPEITEHTHSADCFAKNDSESPPSDGVSSPTESSAPESDALESAKVGENAPTEENDADNESDEVSPAEDLTPQVDNATAHEGAADGEIPPKSAESPSVSLAESPTESTAASGSDEHSSTGDTSALVCGKGELHAHAHDESCFGADGKLICGKTELLYHTHSRECFGKWTLVCTLDEHVHSDECNKNASDETDADGEDAENAVEYFCGKAEHTHTDTCRDENGNLTCTLGEHAHGEICTKAITYCGIDAHVHTDKCRLESGEMLCTKIEHTHTIECTRTEKLTGAELESLASSIDAELSELEKSLSVGASLTDEQMSAARALLTRLDEMYLRREIDDETYVSLYARGEKISTDALESVAEPCYGTNHIIERAKFLAESAEAEIESVTLLSSASASRLSWSVARAEADNKSGEDPPSTVQVDSAGGSDKNETDNVEVSKTIEGTNIENVFDITLSVKTQSKIEEMFSEPDMAVVIVMDISNSMTDDFGGVTRYQAAMTAAEHFLDDFASKNTLGVSKIGYVAFNTNAHEIFGLQKCTNATEAGALKKTMKTETREIINSEKYDENHSRFTNIEAGLKMANDMLAGVNNKNKFIVFLSDGFPTTYVSSGYNGYDPYDSTGKYLHDDVLNKKCLYGTSYSDRAAVKAREMATSIKASGTTIFSIGVDVGGQIIQKYITQSENSDGFSVVDRTSTTYEIGSATSLESYKNWLKDSIGSGYYYDSTNAAGLQAAYDAIFEQIKTTVETANRADWVAEDPIPSVTPDELEFIGMYDINGSMFYTDKDGNLKPYQKLEGKHENSSENTAAYTTDKSTISWDLKKSGYTEEKLGSTTMYTYKLKYRVRLKNEDAAFKEETIYNTNGTTTLTYKTIKVENGKTEMSDPKTINFPIPSVHGFLGELEFTKLDNRGNALAGVTFTLTHLESCDKCHGDGKGLEMSMYTAVSDENGIVSFEKIPSGHSYELAEPNPPAGYQRDGRKYIVTVSYDTVTVTVTDSGGNELEWNEKIINHTSYELPNTGGGGTLLYTAGGAVLILAALCLLYYNIKRRREENFSP